MKAKGQLQFNLGDTGTAHPGDLTPDAWAARNDVSYHVSTDERMERGHGFTHFGTPQAGQEAVQGDVRGAHGDGALFTHARRLSGLSGRTYADGDANAAHAEAAKQLGFPVSDTVGASAKNSTNGSAVRSASRNLELGRSVAYENDAEDWGSISYVAPESAQHSYLEDVAASPNRPQHQREWAGVMASRQSGYPSNNEGNLDVSHRLQTFRQVANRQYTDAPSEDGGMTTHGSEAWNAKKALDSWTAAGVWK